jgi:hypothetical protein
MFIGTFATAFALAFPYNARDLQHDLRAVIHIGSYTCRRPAPFFSDDPGCDSCRELYAVGLAEFCDRLFFPHLSSCDYDNETVAAHGHFTRADDNG